MRCLIILLVQTFLLYGCKSSEEQQLCLKDYIDKVKETPEYLSVRSAAEDTVSSWIAKDVKFFGHLDTDAEWMIDSAVFFSADRSKAVLLLLQKSITPNAKIDFVKVIAAEKKEDNWNFYSKSMPNLAFPRNMNPTTSTSRQFTYKQLSEISREELINGGYFDWRSCSINYDYVNDWLKEPLAEYHQEFLKRRSEN